MPAQSRRHGTQTLPNVFIKTHEAGLESSGVAGSILYGGEKKEEVWTVDPPEGGTPNDCSERAALQTGLPILLVETHWAGPPVRLKVLLRESACFVLLMSHISCRSFRRKLRVRVPTIS